MHGDLLWFGFFEIGANAPSFDVVENGFVISFKKNKGEQPRRGQ
jgi:hypothetical protein